MSCIIWSICGNDIPSMPSSPPDSITWVKQRKKHCFFNKYSTPYSTLEAAKAACLELDPYCTGVYDFGCDGRNSFYLCKKGGFQGDDEDLQCVYAPHFPGSYKQPPPHPPSPQSLSLPVGISRWSLLIWHFRKTCMDMICYSMERLSMLALTFDMIQT